VRRYLNSTPASTQRREQLEHLLKELEKFSLTKAERLQILNLMPHLLVELYVIVPQIEERFSDEEISNLLSLIAIAQS